MLPRRLRLSRSRFGAARTHQASSRHFSLASALAPGERGGCAAVVSKGVARLSTTRHLLKRRMFSVMRPWCVSSRSLIVYAKAGSPRLAFPELSSELSSLLVRVFGPAR